MGLPAGACANVVVGVAALHAVLRRGWYLVAYDLKTTPITRSQWERTSCKTRNHAPAYTVQKHWSPSYQIPDTVDAGSILSHVPLWSGISITPIYSVHAFTISQHIYSAGPIAYSQLQNHHPIPSRARDLKHTVQSSVVWPCTGIKSMMVETIQQTRHLVDSQEYLLCELYMYCTGMHTTACTNINNYATRL